MNSDELKERTKNFAHRCVKLAISLPAAQLGRHIRGQLIRSSTSVAANYRSACMGQSKASFISKLSIVLEETDESCFWMEFILEEKIIKKSLIKPLLNEGEELRAIFTKSLITSRSRKSNKNNLKS